MTREAGTMAYKLLPNDSVYGLDVALPETLDIDESRMCVVIPFADGNHRDGVGDLLEVGGIRTERHRKNPICLFNHGKNYHLPVALAEDPQTQAYTVAIDPIAKVAVAKMFFYQGQGGNLVGEQKDAHCLFCEQLFHLVCQKFIRSGSIGYRVIKQYELPPDYDKGLVKGSHLIETELLEASIVTLPANQDTVRKCLDMKMVCGKPLSPYLRKCLEPYAGQKKTQWGYESPLNPKSSQSMPGLARPCHDRPGPADPCDAVLAKENGIAREEKAIAAVPLRNVRGPNQVPPARWKPGVGAMKMQGMRTDEESYRSLETADSPMGGEPMKSQPSSHVSPEKARQILHDGTVRGHPLTEKQRRMFGAAAGKDRKDMEEEEMKELPSSDISPEKARQMLKDGTAHGHPLTEKQRRMLQAAAHKGQKGQFPGDLEFWSEEQKEREHRLKLLRELYGQKALEEGKVPSAEEVKPRLKTGHRIKPLSVDRARAKKRAAHLPAAAPSSGAHPPGGGPGSLPAKALSDRATKDMDMQPEELDEERTPADLAEPTYQEEQEQTAPGSFPASESSVPKYSLQVLERMKEDALLLLEEYDEMRGPLEHEEIDGHMVRKLQALVAEVEEIEGLIETHHPETANGDQLRDKYTQGAEAPSEAIEDAGDMEVAEAEEENAEAADEQPEENEDLAAEADGEREPTPEEAVEGMRHDPRQKKAKSLTTKGKAMCPKHKVVHPDGAQHKDGMGIEDGHMPGHEAMTHHPLHHHKHHLLGAHNFLHDVAHHTEWSDEHRMKAYHYHKLLDDAGRLLEAEAGAGTSTMTPHKDFEAVAHADEVGHVQHPHTKALQDASMYLHGLSQSHGPMPEERAKALLHWNAMGSLMEEITEAAIQHPAGESEYTPGEEPMQQLKSSFAQEHKALQGIKNKLAGLTKLIAS